MTLTDVLSNPSLDACPDDCFRPVGLAIDDEDRLFMASDSTGDIWVLDRAEFSSLGGAAGVGAGIDGGATTSSASRGLNSDDPATTAPLSSTLLPTAAAGLSRGGNGSAVVFGAFVAVACLAFTSLMS